MVNQSTEGIIQTLTNNSIKINNMFIKFFDTKYLKGLKVGDEVGINYKEVTKDNKLYRNGVSVVKFEPKADLNKTLELTNVNSRLDTTQKNTIMMSVVSIYNKQLEVYHDFKAIQTLGEITKEVLNAYSLIK